MDKKVNVLRIVVRLLTIGFAAAVVLPVFALVKGTAATLSLQNGARSDWLFLCGAAGIVHSNEDQISHSPDRLQRQIGSHLSRIMITGDSDLDYTAIMVKRGHAVEGAEGIVRVARKYGYILHFPHGEKYDPAHGWGREHLNWQSPCLPINLKRDDRHQRI